MRVRRGWRVVGGWWLVASEWFFLVRYTPNEVAAGWMGGGVDSHRRGARHRESDGGMSEGLSECCGRMGKEVG